VRSRLSTVALDLAQQLESQPAAALRDIAEGAATLAVARAGLADPRLDAALAAIRSGVPVDPAELSGIRRLADHLDEIAWDTQDQAEQGILPQRAYHEAFARARAAAAVSFALEAEALQAALESVYEAWFATDDPDAVRMAVRNALS
jgi:hypothetical protein